MFVRPHISILNYVLGFAIVSENRTRHPVETLVVTAHDDFKERGFTGENAPHSLFIAQLQQSRLKQGAGSHDSPPMDRVRRQPKGYNVTYFFGALRLLALVHSSFLSCSAHGRNSWLWHSQLLLRSHLGELNQRVCGQSDQDVAHGNVKVPAGRQKLQGD